MKVKIFADGAKLEDMVAAYKAGTVTGFTTNPSLMHEAGVTNYEEFAKKALAEITDGSISFEVFADDFATMKTQAQKITKWGHHVYVKIPVTNSKGESSIPLIRDLSGQGIKLNITAILTADQVGRVVEAVSADTPSIVSVFAGRVADTGVDPVPLMIHARELCAVKPKAELLRASCREVFNIYQADNVGCHIITVPLPIVKKLPLGGKDLHEYSLDTVKGFLKDATSAGFTL